MHFDFRFLGSDTFPKRALQFSALASMSFNNSQWSKHELVHMWATHVDRWIKQKYSAGFTAQEN